jgi:hypothetical protein
MTDRPEDSSAETPMQRALRLKKAAQGARSGAPANAQFQRAQIAGIPAGKSKPQMRK